MSSEPISWDEWLRQGVQFLKDRGFANVVNALTAAARPASQTPPTRDPHADERLRRAALTVMDAWRLNARDVSKRIGPTCLTADKLWRFLCSRGTLTDFERDSLCMGLNLTPPGTRIDG